MRSWGGQLVRARQRSAAGHFCIPAPGGAKGHSRTAGLNGHLGPHCRCGGDRRLNRTYASFRAVGRSGGGSRSADLSVGGRIRGRRLCRNRSTDASSGSHSGTAFSGRRGLGRTAHVGEVGHCLSTPVDRLGLGDLLLHQRVNLSDRQWTTQVGHRTVALTLLRVEDPRVAPCLCREGLNGVLVGIALEEVHRAATTHEVGHVHVGLVNAPTQARLQVTEVVLQEHCAHQGIGPHIKR